MDNKDNDGPAFPIPGLQDGADIKANSGSVQPIPRSLFAEIAEIRARAEENRRRDLLGK